MKKILQLLNSAALIASCNSRVCNEVDTVSTKVVDTTHCVNAKMVHLVRIEDTVTDITKKEMLELSKEHPELKLC